MRKLTLFIVVLIQFYCSPKKHLEIDDCHENMQFKNIFFRIVSEIDFAANPQNQTISKMKIDDFYSKLDSLSMYVQININDLAQTSSAYSSYDMFLKDKESWLKWYDKNKCKNIKLIWTTEN